MQISTYANRATASKVGIFTYCAIILLYFALLIASPGTRTPSSAGSLAQTEWICCAYGDVKRKAGVRSTLSAYGVPISPWAKWGAFVATRNNRSRLGEIRSPVG